ncbi:hypothetical protein ACVME8_004784 [Bradyrhizobium diazoefficiens]
MRLIRFMLIDLALMLVAPESAEATISYWADFKSAREAVGSLMPISGRGPVFSFGVSRHLCRPTSQAAPFEHSPEGLGPAKQTKDLALLERRRLTLKVSAPATVPIATIHRRGAAQQGSGLETALHASLPLYTFLRAAAPCWSGIDWMASSITITSSAAARLLT